jgi:hypothetical protein
MDIDLKLDSENYDFMSMFLKCVLIKENINNDSILIDGMNKKASTITLRTTLDTVEETLRLIKKKMDALKNKNNIVL